MTLGPCDFTVHRCHGVRYYQLVLNKPRKLPLFSEYPFIDAEVRATTFKGKFTLFVKKMVEIATFED